jgi:excisionase family DNA binding protein
LAPVGEGSIGLISLPAHAVCAGNLRRNRTFTGVTRAFYSLKEAAAMIGVHPDTVRKWLKKKQKNRPPARKIGPQRIGFPRAKFHQWLEGTQ